MTAAVTRAAAPASDPARRWWAAYARIYDWLWDGPATDAVCAALRLHARGPLLDAATGTGLVGSRLAGADLIGIDTSPAMLARAARRPGTWLLADAARPPFAPATFGTVVAANVVHLYDRPDLLLAALARLVRPGGALLACWPADRAGTWSMYRWEMRNGHSAGRALAGVAARAAVGLGALPVRGLRRNPAASIRAALMTVAAAQHLFLTTETVMDGLQHLAVLTRPPPEEPSCPNGQPGGTGRSCTGSRSPSPLPSSSHSSSSSSATPTSCTA